mmetsp:Transcript_133969/g.317691  ORF Transcript_133969/g.317691 Transcript_133969/m.317691 type:complete len:505 (+) Transcript_133969:64-1578(+)
MLSLLLLVAASTVLSQAKECRHGTYDHETKKCICDENWATAGITDTVDFLKGVCEQFRCKDDAHCRRVLGPHITDVEVTCPVTGWNCYCGWNYAFQNGYRGYETGNETSQGGECMGVMYTFSVWTTLTYLEAMQVFWKMVLAVAVIFLPCGRKRVRCDHHAPTLLNCLRDLCGCPPECAGDCYTQEAYALDSFCDDLAWSLYVIGIGVWVCVFLSTFWLLTLFVWSIVLWAMVIVMVVLSAIFGLCTLCGEAVGGDHNLCCCDCVGDCCPCEPVAGGGGGDELARMYWGGPDPYLMYGCDFSGASSTEPCCLDCHCCCCFPLAWLITRFPRMPENLWGGAVGYCLGTHRACPQNEAHYGSPMIDFLGLNWLRQRHGDLHGDLDWRQDVYEFLMREPVPPPVQDGYHSQGEFSPLVDSSFRIGPAVGEHIHAKFNKQHHKCVESSFEDYANNQCWICQSSNSDWDLWLTCRHMFCKRCSEEMLRRRMPCPLCRVYSPVIQRGYAT